MIHAQVFRAGPLRESVPRQIVGVFRVDAPAPHSEAVKHIRHPALGALAWGRRSQAGGVQHSDVGGCTEDRPLVGKMSPRERNDVRLDQI